MKVVFANATRTWAGVKTWMVELAAFLARRGHTVDVVCRPGNAMLDACQARGIACRGIDFGPDLSPRCIAAFVRLYRRQGTNVVITNISKDLRTAGVAARLSGVAHVNRLGDIGDILPTWRTHASYRWLVDRVLVPSQALVDHFSAFPFLAPKLRRFPNAVEPQTWSEKDAGPTRFAILARLSARKQVDEVLRVLARVVDLPWELHVAGTGPEHARLVDLAAALRLGGRVFFERDPAAPVARIDAARFLENKHVGILYSRREAFGWAILEYMASSCAVIASAVSGPEEILGNSGAGLLVDPGDPAALEAAIRELIVHPERRRALARAAHARVGAEYSQAAVFSAVEAELEATIAERRRRARGHPPP